MESIIFIAPPAAGKGTQSDLISKKYNIPQISVGDILREEVKNGSELGEEIEFKMNNGILLDDEFISELIKKRIALPDCNNGYILDGYPRNVNQANIYDEMLKSINHHLGYVFFLNVPKEETKKRITGRISCPKCKTVFSETFESMKPKQEGICDHCQTELVKRIDDNEETYEKRYQTYLDETEPLINYYKDKDYFYQINAIEKDVIFKELCNILDEEVK